MKYWVNAYAPMYDVNGVKITTVPERAVVETLSWRDTFGGVVRENVVYYSADKSYRGFIYEGYLEPYTRNYQFNCVAIASQTPQENDAEQYAIINGVKQTELCGEISAAYLLGVSLDDVLAEWQREKPSIFQVVFNLFSTRKARGTGPGELATIFQAFEKNAVMLSDALRDPVLKVPRYTVTGLSAVARRAIVGVKINKLTGRLSASGILHWVVVTKVIPERTGYGLIEIFNPFPDCVEVYGWEQFIASAGVPYGVVMDE